MNKIVIATRNLKKGSEMISILDALLGKSYSLYTLNDFPEFPEPDEKGDTYEENACIKANESMKHLGLPCIADDAGLEIDALGGAPGVHSKRFEGIESTFQEKTKKILELMEGVPSDKRRARFVCCVAYSHPDRETRVFKAIKEGIISEKPIGDHGFGYDPIFFLPEVGKTYAQLLPEEKNHISHRAIVLNNFAQWLLSERNAKVNSLSSEQ